MGYSIKWLSDNLGITRDMIRHYEKAKLIPANTENKYRNYSDEEIERIWGIKLLIEIGFSTKEIYALMHDPEFDFDTAIAKKVKKLEQEYDKMSHCLGFAKTIKMTGRIPTTSKIGSIRFDDFIAIVRENWDIYNDPHTVSLMKKEDEYLSKSLKEEQSIWGEIENFDTRKRIYACALLGYFQIISDMKEFTYDSDVVQKVVRLLHEYMNAQPEFEGKITPQFIARDTASLFVAGDVSKDYEKIYGKEGCQFIAQALAYYGGYKIKDL